MKRGQHVVDSEDNKMSRHFAGDEKGATSVEYAIIASLIAGVIIAIVIQLGIKVRGLFVINGW